MKKEEEKVIDLEYYGKYMAGLTAKEIKEYLKHRAGVTRLGNLWNKFVRIAGCNTMALVDGQALMYRYDVERFANVLFLGKTTYFD